MFSQGLQRQFNLIAAEHARTADLLRAVLRPAFNKAIQLGRMKSNPVLATDPVQHVQAEAGTFTAEQALRFPDAAREDRLGALFIIALSLGLRKGEGIGLKPDDLDLDNRIVHVRRSLQWVKRPGEEQGHWIERPPKRDSFRKLPMTETVCRAVVHHMARREHESAATSARPGRQFFYDSDGPGPHAVEHHQAVHARADRGSQDCGGRTRVAGGGHA